MPRAPLVERQRGIRRDRHPERVLRRDLVEADRRQPDPADDHRRLAGLVRQQVEHGPGRPDQLLGGHVGPAPDDQPRPEPVAGALAIDEAEARRASADSGRSSKPACRAGRRARLPGPRRGPRSSGGRRSPRANDVSSAASSGGRSRAVDRSPSARTAVLTLPRSQPAARRMSDGPEWQEESRRARRSSHDDRLERDRYPRPCAGATAPSTTKPARRGRAGFEIRHGGGEDQWVIPCARRNAFATSLTSFWLTATSTPICVSCSVVIFAETSLRTCSKAVLSTLAR